MIGMYFATRLLYQVEVYLCITQSTLMCLVSSSVPRKPFALKQGTYNLSNLLRDTNSSSSQALHNVPATSLLK